MTSLGWRDFSEPISINHDGARRFLVGDWPKVTEAPLDLLEGRGIDASVAHVLGRTVRVGALVRFAFEQGVRDYEIVELDALSRRAYLRRID